MDKENKGGTERERTDESLRTEREKTDRALSDRRHVEKNADKVVSRAREGADEIVMAAREKVDKAHAQTSEKSGADSATREARAHEDKALQDERASSDKSLVREREESARALRSLLKLEREKTDRYLLTERARSDDDVANRDDFLGIAAHDLRNLLGGIVMSVGNIARRSPEGEDGKKILEETNRITRYTARMNRLIGDLVDVVRINAGKLALSPESTDAAKLIEEAVETFQASAAEKRISLDSELIQRHLPVEMDYDRMFQVMCNVVSNAIKFSFQGGRISIRGERARDGVRIAVSDTGPGIPEHLIVAVFERFWQGGEKDERGLGLGLYISKAIVEAHGGRIWAESKVDSGTTFFITLPGAANRAG